jgi:hypothetical protein
MWADQVPECKVTETEGGFKCPNPKDNPNPGTFSRHAHPDDCRKYYICLDNSPREYGCPIGTVYQIGSDVFSGQCTDPEGVEGCENYYGDDLKGIRKSELLLGGGGDQGASYNQPSKPTTRKKVAQPKPVVVEEAPVAKPVQQQQPSRVVQSSRERVRTVPVQQQPQQQQPQQQVQQSRPVPVTTQRPAPTTEAPKPTPDAKLDDYYYYESDEVPAQRQP